MTDIWIYVLLAALGGLLLIGLLIKLAGRISRFREELRYIDMEISRSDGGERQRWKEKKHCLWRRFFFGDRKR